MSPAQSLRRSAGRKALDDLRRYRRTISMDRYLADTDEQRKVLHALLIAVQSVVDEGLAACRRLGLALDDTYRGAFRALGEAGQIPAEWIAPLMDWASLRNVLAHFYPVIDMRKAYECIDEIDLLEQFLDWSESAES